MPEHYHYHDEDIVNLDTRHEETDVNVRALLIFIVVFIVFGIATHLGLWVMFKFFVRLENGRTNAPLTEMAEPPDANIPASPRLQPFPTKSKEGLTNEPYRNTPVTDLEDLRAREEAALNGYGWVDPQKGVVRIPIEQAKQLALQRGFPVAAATDTTAAAPPAGTVNAPATPPAASQNGDSNAARIAPVNPQATAQQPGSAHP